MSARYSCHLTKLPLLNVVTSGRVGECHPSLLPTIPSIDFYNMM